MPPKKDNGPSKKTVQKQQEKIIEDKTFGLKNKNKSKAVQKFIKGVETQVKKGNQKGGEGRTLAELAKQKEAEKKQAEKEALLNSLFRSVIAAGGEKIKQEQRVDEKIDLYTDQRDLINNGEDEDENMENWDEEKLKLVVNEKETGYKAQNKTDKVCIHFLDAVEKRKYGWRWVCPSGETCIYKHCLPPGYVLKLPEKREAKEERTLEEVLEEERGKLGTAGTPVTLDSFKKWREEKLKRKEQEIEKKRLEEIKKNKGGKGFNVLSGRALFKYDPTLFADDEGAADNKEYEDRDTEQGEEEDYREEHKHEEGDDDEEGEEGEEEEQNEDGEENEEQDNQEEEEDNGDIKISKKTAKQDSEDGKVIEAHEQTDTTASNTDGTLKKKKKKGQESEEKSDVKVNEDVFLNEEDVDLPE